MCVHVYDQGFFLYNFLNIYVPDCRKACASAKINCDLKFFYSYTVCSCALMLYCDDVITAAAIAIIL